jgi:hypothetical protein
MFVSLAIENAMPRVRSSFELGHTFNILGIEKDKRRCYPQNSKSITAVFPLASSLPIKTYNLV